MASFEPSYHGLILFSHGSVLCGASQMLYEHAVRLRESGAFATVEVGFLNYTEPTFLDAVQNCAAQGLVSAIVAPYFLVAGKFVAVDIPREVARAAEAFPELRLTVAEPIGYDPRLADAILDLASVAASRGSWREDVRHAPEFCRANPRCPLFGFQECPSSSGTNPLAGDQIEWPQVPTALQITNSKIQNPALLVVAHGSPDPSANRDMLAVVDEISRRAAYPIVEPGFLDCNEPDIPTAIDRCVELGASRIDTVPYFLHTGRHVADDIPTLLEEGSRRHLGVEFRLGRYLGSSRVITDTLADRAMAVGSDDGR